MYIFLIGAISFLVFLSATAAFDSSIKVDHTPEHQATVLEIDKYRTFLFVADQYMKSSPAAVSTPTAVSWDTLKAHPFTAPGAKTLAMPNNWKIVRNPDNSWVACTELSERSISAVWQLAPSTSGAAMTPVISVAGQLPKYVVIGEASTASTNAALCD